MYIRPTMNGKETAARKPKAYGSLSSKGFSSNWVEVRDLQRERCERYERCETLAVYARD